MKIKKSIQLTTAPLEELIATGESVDFRLDEAAWHDLEAGNHIEFWEDFTGWQKEPTDESRRVIVRIEHIYKASSFQELFGIIEQDTERLGDKDELSQGLRSWWSEDKETTEGVLAFYVEVV
jgi:ASC-1-like (ASCH) protein